MAKQAKYTVTLEFTAGRKREVIYGTADECAETIDAVVWCALPERRSFVIRFEGDDEE